MLYAKMPVDCKEILHAFETRRITHAFHDIDGTHSLIRDWPPVMSIVLYDTIIHGLPEDFDSAENEKRLIDACGKNSLPETDRFCVESAGLSALTQMEWSIRRSVEEGNIQVECDHAVNSEIIQRIWNGSEIFNDLTDTEDMKHMLARNTPRLFKLYERVLNGYCRDRNLEIAKANPEKFMVAGSFEFLSMLKEHGVKNYFVTGAVVQQGMGMYEEVETLGYKTGPGEMIEALIGSTWTDKLPKHVIMKQLREKLGIDGQNVLVVGDGRAEIEAGVQMGALVISRLPVSSTRQHELHRALGTNLIVGDYYAPVLGGIFTEKL